MQERARLHPLHYIINNLNHTNTAHEQ